jgi:hypothetical protein
MNIANNTTPPNKPLVWDAQKAARPTAAALAKESMVFAKTIFILDILFIVMIVLAPSIFIPTNIFGENIAAVALIGGKEGATSVLLSAEPSKWGDILFVVLIMLIACNAYWLFAFFKKRIKNKNVFC